MVILALVAAEAAADDDAEDDEAMDNSDEDDEDDDASNDRLSGVGVNRMLACLLDMMDVSPLSLACRSFSQLAKLSER